MIDVQGLTYTYAGRTAPAVNGISFQVGAGEVFGFLGPNGAGKSTTQKILIGLLTGHQGTVQVLGKDIRAWGSDLYEHIGVSFELPNHYSKLTGLENLQFFRDLYTGPTEDPRALLDLVDLADAANVRVAQYSKGMQMRLNVARALLNRPELVFMDEPTSGLDPVSSRHIKGLLRRLGDEGRTVFLTTHNMTVADEVCDRVAFIVDGQVKLIDAPRTLKLQHGQREVRVEYSVDHHTAWRAYPLAGLGQNEDFLALLRTFPVETIHTQEATLEDIFIRVTGRSLT